MGRVVHTKLYIHIINTDGFLSKFIVYLFLTLDLQHFDRFDSKMLNGMTKTCRQVYYNQFYIRFFFLANIVDLAFSV